MPFTLNHVSDTDTITGPDVTLAMSLANGLAGTGFISRYRLQPRVGI